jgi:CHAT domain-containing protein
VQREIVGGLKWGELPGTESEAAYVASLYQRLMGLPAGSERIVYLRGAAATEEAFRAAAPECYLLHLATHGFFASEDKRSALALDDAQRDALRDNPFGERLAAIRGYSPGLLSALVLAGVNEPAAVSDDPQQPAALPDDGYLTAEEISFMRLSGAQLVVMSACESGLGETAGGEGLLGVQRAFQVAGARTTIATLWKVSDEHTRRIMEEFYRNYLERQMSPQEALRAAQLRALNHPDLVPRGADAPAGEGEAGTPSRLPPQYWAAFTLSGDWR